MKKLETWAKGHKKLLLLVSTCLCGIVGGGLYLLAALLSGNAPAVDVLLCWMGYPAILFGFLGSLFTLYRIGN